MESPLICVIVLFLNVFDLSLGVIYNRGDVEKSFVCSSEGYSEYNEIIKLFLSSGNMKIRCFFQSENEITSKGILGVFTSGGLAPSLGILNSTYHGIFHFDLTLANNGFFWQVEIPRENITKNTDIAATEEWLVRLTLHQGLDIYTTEGTLLDLVREPILQWTLGTELSLTQISELYPHVVDLKVAKCPCANDVALLGFVLNSTYNGVFVGLTYSGFWNYNETTWYDMTDIIYSQLQEEHPKLTLIDMVLTNHFLVILTSLGLYVSGDLRYPSTQLINLSRADFCGFERVDYVKGRLWYNEKCFANREPFEVDYVTITFERNKTLSEASSCFYGKEPFLNWLPCIPYNVKDAKFLPTVVTFLIDQEQNTGIYFFYNLTTRRISCAVSILKNDESVFQIKFPTFQFPYSFSIPTGMVFHPRSHFLYVYGNQLWISMDGGNTFELVADFYGGVIKSIYHSFYTSDIALVARNGRVYLTKAGLRRYARIGVISDKVFALYYDHLGFIHKLAPDYFDAGSEIEAFGNTRTIFGKDPDMGFETALAPQYISMKEVIFFAYVPLTDSRKTAYGKKFKNIHHGKLIISLYKVGTASIKKVLYHKVPLGFQSSAVAELTDPFAVEEGNESSCLFSSLSIQEASAAHYQLVLDLQNANASFQDTDIEKTVVIPGYSSFLILEILDAKNALALATMPASVPTNTTFPAGSWFLHNFGLKDGRKWRIEAKPCNYLVQQMDNTLSISFVKYIDVGNSEKIQVKIIPNSQGTRTIDIPLLKVLVGNPSLLEVKLESYFDDTDSYSIEVFVDSKSLHQNSISLALVLWEAAADCFVTTLVPTLKSSCSYLRSMHHVPSTLIPDEHWISGVHMDSQGFNMIKTLPVNYRPPSNMGIAIPLTDNFYHADPSKPIPRNLFHKSKETGRYKQCANASSRKECNCTNDQKFSDAVAFSDCKEKVPRFKFPVSSYPVSLEIFSESGLIPVKSSYLVTVTEVNSRKNWQLRHTVPENIKKMKSYLESVLHESVYNPLGLNLSIMIYVDETPLPFPGQALIALATAVVLGGLIFTAFMFQLHNIHPLRAFRRWIRRNKMNLSSVSVT